MLLTNKDAVVASSARYLLILGIATIPLFTFFMGIYGPSVALILVYLVMIAYLKQSETRGAQY